MLRKLPTLSKTQTIVDLRRSLRLSVDGESVAALWFIHERERMRRSSGENSLFRRPISCPESIDPAEIHFAVIVVGPMFV
jgi:hypothetical protein